MKGGQRFQQRRHVRGVGVEIERVARRLHQLPAVRRQVGAGPQFDLAALRQEFDLDPAAGRFGGRAGSPRFVAGRSRCAPGASQDATAHLLDAGQRALLPERQHAGDVIRWAVPEAHPRAAGIRGAAARRRSRGAAGAAQLRRLQAHLFGEHRVEPAQALEAAGERDLGDGQVGVGQQLLGLQQPLRGQVVDGTDAMAVREHAPQVPLRDAQPGGQFGHAHGRAHAHGVIDHARGMLRQHMRRIHQAQARCELRAAAQAGPEPGLLGAGGIGVEAAVLAPRRAHPADGAAVDVRRRDADEEAAVEARVVRGECLPGGVGIEFHALIIGTRASVTRRFRTHESFPKYRLFMTL